MTPHQKRPSHLTVRLAEDMRIWNLAHRTTDAYTYEGHKDGHRESHDDDQYD